MLLEVESQYSAPSAVTLMSARSGSSSPFGNQALTCGFQNLFTSSQSSTTSALPATETQVFEPMSASSRVTWSKRITSFVFPESSLVKNQSSPENSSW